MTLFKENETENLSFEDWYDIHEDEIYIYAAESGADRELDYESELFVENQYSLYTESFITHHSPSNSQTLSL